MFTIYGVQLKKIFINGQICFVPNRSFGCREHTGAKKKIYFIVSILNLLAVSYVQMFPEL